MARIREENPDLIHPGGDQEEDLWHNIVRTSVCNNPNNYLAHDMSQMRLC